MGVLECHSVDCIQPCIMPPSCCHHAAPCKIWLLCSSPACAGLVMVMTQTGSSVRDSQAATSAGTPLAIYPTPSESNHQNCSPNIPRIIHHNCSPQLLNTTPTSGQFSTDSRHSLTPTQRCRCPCSTAPCQFQLQPVVLEKGTMPANALLPTASSLSSQLDVVPMHVQ